MPTPVSSKGSLEHVQRAPTPIVRQPGYRKHERRWRNATFILVERRKGKRWMYGSIALAGGLWAYIYFFVHFR